ncbi:uncharacterized protein EV154DRAFT_489277 [Mucor mucedo]|uniref:uncharacterized protein n=1 Tax=Mucor mucedo TaxID=29922 RepID=UPI00221E8156|nr:uncharacterized protein EV154DRAFT_489277 [Mucor mucedo]KAI7897195.1 hypothetical protein EV154DRAFT_489277 [Mucor mucedo]
MYQASSNEAEKKVPKKQFKTIAPTTVTTTTPQAPTLQKNVPPFLNKLYSMVSDPESDELICWAEDGVSFFVNRQEDFARKVLPRFFKHKKFSSFVRQLNMYGFHKVPHLQQGVLETDGESERWEFSNPHFQRDQPDRLLLVNRKKGPNTDEKEISSIDLHHILEEIQSIKKHQTNISTQLQNIQRDNQVLWQETIAARERHLRHQETIDKILRFLASVFSSKEKRPAIPRKRRYLLGPADGSDHDEGDVNEPDNGVRNSATSITEESRKANKKPRQNEPTTSFNIDDYVSGKNELLELSNALPEHLKDSATNTTSSDLEDAIALNDQSKIDHSALASINDFSNIANIPQLQNLQSLITLAQSNPELLNQLTNEAFYGNSTGPFTDQSDQQYNNNNSYMNNDNNSNNGINTYTANNNNSNNNDNTNKNNSFDSSFNQYKSASVLTSSPSAINTIDNQQQAARTINQVTNTISNITHTADALNQDIDDLGISLQALAHHLGFDPTKGTPADDDKIDEDEDDLLDMDEFLNTYGPDVHPELIETGTETDSIILELPSSTAIGRSSSPVVSTPGSVTSTQTTNKM